MIELLFLVTAGLFMAIIGGAIVGLVFLVKWVLTRRTSQSPGHHTPNRWQPPGTESQWGTPPRKPR